METRALAIAFFYAVGTAAGGIAGPLLFGHLIASGSQDQVAIGFFIGAVVMAIGGIAELLFGVRAEQKQLEDIAEPLTAEGARQPKGRGADHAHARKRPPGRRPVPATLPRRCRLGPDRRCRSTRGRDHRAALREHGSANRGS